MNDNTMVIDLDLLETSAKEALRTPVSGAFLAKTNDELDEWMTRFYQPENQHQFRLHCLWAWQQQERKIAPVLLELIHRLRAAEALATARIETIPTDTRVLAIFADINPEHRAEAEEFTNCIQRRTSSWTLVAYFNTDASIEALSVEAMAKAGWVRAPKEDV